jgi:hypothetical protein
MAAGWLSEVRQLAGSIDAALLDLRGEAFATLPDPDDYGPSQALGRHRRAFLQAVKLRRGTRRAPDRCR